MNWNEVFTVPVTRIANRLVAEPWLAADGRRKDCLVPVSEGKPTRSLPMAATMKIKHPSRDRVWPVLRGLSVAGTACAISLDLTNPSLGLRLFWSGLIAYLPLLFLVAPGIWRNICPMATLNGLPRSLGRGGKRRLSGKVQRRTPFIAVALFFLLVPLRAVGLDRDGHALALFLLALLSAALGGGLLVAGKAGWCSQICPMLAVERLYGVSPLVPVRDTHCAPCVGCAKNCYDLQPRTAGFTEISNTSNPAALARLLFAGAMPWFCLGFFTQSHLDHLTAQGLFAGYARLGLFVLAGMAVGLSADRYAPWSRYQVVVVHAALAVSIYYLFVVRSTLTALHIQALPVTLIAHGLPLLVAAIWLRRALAREQSLRSESASPLRQSPRVA